MEECLSVHPSNKGIHISLLINTLNRRVENKADPIIHLKRFTLINSINYNKNNIFQNLQFSGFEFPGK